MVYNKCVQKSAFLSKGLEALAYTLPSFYYLGYVITRSSNINALYTDCPIRASNLRTKS